MTIGKCDWCSGTKLHVNLHRDATEGFFGPEYLVCTDCRHREAEAAHEELESMPWHERLSFEAFMQGED